MIRNLTSQIKSGLPENVDYNLDRGKSGISRFQATVDSGGTRASTSAAYLPASVSSRPNLGILTLTLATKLLVENGRVAGIELAQSKEGSRYHVKARKEVVVCSGAYCTPQLLQVSGIGPKSEVEKLGVKLEVELDGVGRGLKDHLMAGPTYNTVPGVSGHYLLHPVKAVRILQMEARIMLKHTDTCAAAMALERYRTSLQ
jgi:choline dehydrogenase